MNDPMIRGASDWNKYLTSKQQKKYMDFLKKDRKKWLYASQALQGGYFNKRRSEVLSFIGETLQSNANKIEQKTGMSINVEPLIEDYTELKTLEETNEVMAAEYASEAPIGPMRQYVVSLGARGDLNDYDVRVVFAAYLTHIANSNGVILDDWLDAYKKNPNVTVATVRAMSGAGAPVQGSGSAFSKFLRHPLKVARRIFVTEFGKGVRRFAQNILNAEENVPFLKQYFTAPLGFHMQAKVLQQIGEAMVDGSINTFDEVAVFKSSATTFTAAGTALLAAAPLLPPPWNVAAAAVGALSVAVGKTINTVIDNAEARRNADAIAEQQSQQLTDAANQNKVAYVYRQVRWPSGVVAWTAFTSNSGGQWVPQFVFYQNAWYPLSA